MDYYEYTPENRNPAEKLLVCLALVFAAASFGVSQLRGIPYPAILQFIAVVFLTVAVALANRCILRSYTYTVTEPDGAGQSGTARFRDHRALRKTAHGGLPGRTVAAAVGPGGACGREDGYPRCGKGGKLHLPLPDPAVPEEVPAGHRSDRGYGHPAANPGRKGTGRCTHALK